MRKSIMIATRRPLTKQDMMNSLGRYKACRKQERKDLMQTARIPFGKNGLFSSRSQGILATADFLTNKPSTPQTFGSLVANSKQERNLLSYEKTQKMWNSRASSLSRKCKRKNKTESLMESSDQYAIKIQELDELAKNSNPCELTDAQYQWIRSLRESK